MDDTVRKIRQKVQEASFITHGFPNYFGPAYNEFGCNEYPTVTTKCLKVRLQLATTYNELFLLLFELGVIRKINDTNLFQTL